MFVVLSSLSFISKNKSHQKPITKGRLQRSMSSPALLETAPPPPKKIQTVLFSLVSSPLISLEPPKEEEKKEEVVVEKKEGFPPKERSLREDATTLSSCLDDQSKNYLSRPEQWPIHSS